MAIVLRITVHTCHHGTEIAVCHAGIAQHLFHLLSHLIHGDETTDGNSGQSTQRVGFLFGIQEHRHRNFSTRNHSLDTYVTRALKQFVIRGYHLIVSSHHGCGNPSQLHLHPSIEQTCIETQFAMRIGHVVAMRLRIDGQG